MAKKVLIIDRDDEGRFFLSVDGETMTIGDSPENAEAVLLDLHVLRIYCDVETDEDVVAVSGPPTATGQPGVCQELHVGKGLHFGHSHLRLEPADETKAEAASPTGKAAPATPKETAPAASPSTLAPLLKQLHVIDGADQGRCFRLPESGSATIGKAPKQADFVLHDLYVSRVHCLVEVQQDRVSVTHIEGPSGTLINGRRITQQQELRLGEVLRVGNSHLRLEPAALDAPEQETPDEAPVGVAEEKPARGEQAAAVPSKPVVQAGPLAHLEGQVLGQYRVGSALGRGHSGVVFRAQNLKTNLVVSLKVLSPEFPANGEELQKFVQALKVVPQLHHANLLAIYNAGRTGTHCWVAREHVEGEGLWALAERLKESGKPTWGRAIRVAVHLGRALAFLHQNRIYHGNITPNNVLVRSADKVTKVSDLMMDTALEGSRLEQAIVEKKLVAEMPYLAPEQTETGAYVDHLADLYALGAVVYVLLTGQPPFSGQSPAEVLEQVRHSSVVRPGKYQRGIPPAFEAAVLKLMAKHQEDRYQTAEQFLADVGPIAVEHQVGL